MHVSYLHLQAPSWAKANAGHDAHPDFSASLECRPCCHLCFAYRYLQTNKCYDYPACKHDDTDNTCWALLVNSTSWTRWATRSDAGLAGLAGYTSQGCVGGTHQSVVSVVVFTGRAIMTTLCFLNSIGAAKLHPNLEPIPATSPPSQCWIV